MTTAYTSLLGLALPVTGELSGTWGDVVNNSITGLLDTAVAGTTTLSTDADVTLSTTTGAANQSRQAIILWTASGTVTRTITAPAQSKIYTIINRSSTQSIKIVGVGPTTGVTVKSGATVTVAWNGLDFVEISVSTLYPTVTISGNMDNGTTDNSLNNAPTVKSAVTTLASVYLSNPSTEAASFTLTSLVGYRAEQGTFGASSTVTNQYGFYANSDLTGATNNYGVYSGIAATAAVTISSVNGTGSTVTVDTSTSHGLNTGDKVIIAGVSNTTMTAGSYNGGPYTITLVDADTFTYSSTATSSAAVTSGGSVVKANNWNIYAGGTGNNWFGGPVINSVSSVLPALRITQTGTGDALLVEDSTNPDSTPFVIDANGRVVVGALTQATTAISNATSMQIFGGTAPLALIRTADSTTPINLEFAKSRANYTTLVSNDYIGRLYFSGHDGTAFIPAAYIDASVDGTPGTNDMPGRLVFSTTADGGTVPTERIRIDSAGNVGIGTSSPTAGVDVANWGTSSSPTLVKASGTVPTTATGTAIVVDTIGTTLAASSPLVTLMHYRARPADTFGAGSALTNQYGYYADSRLTGATNNYGFHSNIASGTGRWNFYAAGTAENFFGGNTVVSVTDNTNAALRITQLGTGNALLVEDSTNPDSSPFVIDAGGSTIVGYTSTVATVQNLGSAITPLLQVQGSGASSSSAGLYNWSTSSSSSSTLAFSKSLSGVVGTRGALTTAGQDLGNVVFAGDDGTNFVAAASILAEVDGTPGTNDMPGRLLFSTTADGASTPTERMRISSTGQITFTAANMLSANPSAFIFNATGKAAQTGNTVGVISSVSTDATYVGTDIFAMYASQGTLTVAPTNQYGFYVQSGFTGATNNYGFYSNIASAAGRWNFYANGTADNYFAGNVGIGTSSPSEKLHISGEQFPAAKIETNSTSSGDSTFNLIGYRTTDSPVGYLKFWNNATSTTELARIVSYRDGVDNSGNLRFYTTSAGTISERMRIDSSGNVLVTNVAGLGYGTGSGGTVTQATSKTTGVTLNKPTGQITMNNAALAANTTVRFLVTNSIASVTDCIMVTIRNGVTAGAYLAWVDGTANGSFTMAVRNITAGSLSDAVVLNFSVIKGATS